ncbi:MAG: DUF2793 domain-containing protein [Pseudomonadota bacterium]|nr:DUF2793 domain-containing protein [Pseudomonadota bacterium]
METTSRLGLPLLIAGQVQKELFHNEALATIDLVVNGSVDEVPITAPPTTPSLGTLNRVASAGATGAFAGREGMLAGYSAGGWRFVAPAEGMRLTERTSGVELAFRNGAWTSGMIRASEVEIGGLKVLGSREPAIADAAGGATIDTEVRLAVTQILAALRTHGLIAS